LNCDVNLVVAYLQPGLCEEARGVRLHRIHSSRYDVSDIHASSGDDGARWIRYEALNRTCAALSKDNAGCCKPQKDHP
jgi:hypothetical protein